MANYIHLYQNNPTANGVDGVFVSEGDNSAPILVTLNATVNEVGAGIKVALRCDAGFQTSGNTLITPPSDKWQLSLDNVTWSAWGSSLTITSVIGPTNTIFYIRSKAIDTEIPVNENVDLVIQSTIAAI